MTPTRKTSPKERIVTRKNIEQLVRRLNRSKKSIVFTNGVFDLLHRGHITYLEKAKSFGDILIVGLNSDASVTRLKGPGRPIQRQSDRALILASLRQVDYVVIFGEDTPEKLILQVSPDVLVKGADYKISEIVGADYVRSIGGSVKRVKLVPGRSSSKLARQTK